MMDNVESGFENTEQIVENTEAILKAQSLVLEDALKFLLSQMLEHAQTHGTYQDLSGALKASLSINLESMGVYETREEAFANMQENQKPVIEVDGDEYWGAISAGMWYAAIVETKQGFTVLQGTIDEFERVAEKYLAAKMSAQDLKQQAARSFKWHQEQV